MDALVAYDLSKQYGTKTALDAVSFQIPQGSIFACVGGETSGKTTLLRLLSGLCKPTQGECTVMGISSYFEPEKAHAVTGTVLETAKLYPQITMLKNMQFYAGMSGIDENDALDRASSLLRKLDIWEGREQKLEYLPTSVVRRASIARALIHRPQVLLLDEPIQGMDQEAVEAVKSLIDFLVAEEGMTVLLATRNVSCAQTLAGGFIILQEGTLLTKGSLEVLRKSAGLKSRAVLRIGENSRVPVGFKRCEDHWEREIQKEEELPGLIAQAVSAGVQIYEAHVQYPMLEDIYHYAVHGGEQKGCEADEPDETNGESSQAQFQQSEGGKFEDEPEPSGGRFEHEEESV